MSRNYRNLKVWETSHEFVKEIYRLTKTFPKDEIFGITSQLRRAAVSIPANIAEGSGRRTEGVYIQVIGISKIPITSKVSGGKIENCNKN